MLLCLAVYVPGLATLPPVDRDESRFAQASRQMFESVALPPDQRAGPMHSGGLAIPMVQERPRLNKPPLIYWLQAGSAGVFTGGDPLRDSIWMYRVPSLLAAIAAVLLTWRLGVMMFDPRAAWLAGALLAVCPIVVWESRQARADMVLLAATTAAMAALYAIWRGRTRTGPTPWLAPLALWLAVGAGVLTKGPITPMVVALTAVAASAASGRWAWLLRTRPALGALIVAACVGPWVYAVANRVGFDKYWSIIHDEVLGRSVASKEGHWGPPGYHLVLLCVLFWPGTLVTALALRRGVGLVRRRAPRSPELFLLAWIVPSWIVFELVSTKLPHYTLPLYPAVALLSARAIFAAAAGCLAGVNEFLTRLGFGAWLVIGAALALAASAALLTPHRDALPTMITGGALLAVVFALALLQVKRALDRREFVLAQARAIALAAFIGVCFVGIALPRLREAWISPRVVAAVPAALTGRPIAAIDFHEDSLVYATRGRLARIDESGAAQWLLNRPDAVVVAPFDVLRRLGLEPLNAPDGTPLRVTGFNYSDGNAVELGLGIQPGSKP